jgi:hypothetical protein
MREDGALLLALALQHVPALRTAGMLTDLLVLKIGRA